MEHKFVICDCGLAEHQAILSFDPDESDGAFQMLYMEIHLRTWHGFFKRLWHGIRYAFGYYCRYGAWDELLINKEEAGRIRDFLDRFIANAPAGEQIIAPDKANRRPESVLCGNCGVYRMVDDQWYVETCPNCGDDEWSIIEAEMEDVP